MRILCFGPSFGTERSIQNRAVSLVPERIDGPTRAFLVRVVCHLALTVIVADTVVAVVGLALAVQVRRYCGTLDIQALTSLRR